MSDESGYTTSITDADIVPEHPEPSTELAAPVAALPVRAAVKASDLVERLDTIKEAMNLAMKPDVDYGVIPGTGSKPTLLKPGAEKLAVLFELDVQITHDEKWGPGDHLTVPAYATIYHAPTGVRLGRGEGLCSTREKKYGKRKQERVCPSCGEPAVIKGKAEYGGGWLCWAKKGGCNSKWPDGAPEIEGQPQGEVENPDLPDTWNTIVKMARKRALVDGVLLVTGASALFTQDVEDQRGGGPETTGESPGPKPAPGPPADRSRKLTDAELGQVVEAVAASGKDAGLLLNTVGAGDFEDLTINKWNQMRLLLTPEQAA